VEGKFVLLGSLDATAQVNNLRTFDSLLAVTDSKPGVELFNATDPAKLVSVGSGKPPLCWWWTDLERTDGNLASGVWVPLNAYGLWRVGSKP